MTRLDPLVHQETRLAILTLLSEARRADFAFLRDTLELTAGNLSHNLALLQEAGYVALEKRSEAGRRTRTWAALTPAGQAALAAEVASLREIIAAVEGVRETSAPPRPRPAPG
jgi:DNA-binding MarR family transcriptional regulator